MMIPLHATLSCAKAITYSSNLSPLTPKSDLTESINLLLGLPLPLTPGTSADKILFDSLSSRILCTYPNQRRRLTPETSKSWTRYPQSTQLSLSYKIGGLKIDL